MSALRHRPTIKQTPAEKNSARAFALALLKGIGKFLFLFFCALACATLVKLSFPKASHGLLAWVALAPFVWGIVRLKSFWSSFFYSWFCGLLVYAGIFYWIYYTCYVGGGMSGLLSAGAWLGLSALLSLQFAIFGGSCYYLKRLPLLFPLLAACGWVALEWLHQVLAYYALGFPWFMLGYSQWNHPELLQVAALGGVYAVSFALVFASVSVGYAFVSGSFKRAVGQILLAILMFGCVHAYGSYVLGTAQKPNLIGVNVALMQPNIDQYKKWSPEFEAEIEETVRVLGAEPVGKNRLLVVWPESVVPGSMQQEKYTALFDELALSSGAFQLVGSNREQEGQQFVSAYLVEPKTGHQQVYDKLKLVPFGEYLPLEGLVRSLSSRIQILGELGSFTPGEEKQPLFNLGGMAFGVTICYESVFPALWLQQNRAGAKFFVNITNDAWFFDTDAPYQHLAINTLRAVEMGRPVLRSANTGISATIDRYGRIRQRVPLDTQAIVLADVPLSFSEEVNFYTQWGDWFAWLCAAIYFTILISAMVFAYE